MQRNAPAFCACPRGSAAPFQPPIALPHGAVAICSQMNLGSVLGLEGLSEVVDAGNRAGVRRIHAIDLFGIISLGGTAAARLRSHLDLCLRPKFGRLLQLGRIEEFGCLGLRELPTDGEQRG